jgi:hypothetical protein
VPTAPLVLLVLSTIENVYFVLRDSKCIKYELQFRKYQQIFAAGLRLRADFKDFG